MSIDPESIMSNTFVAAIAGALLGLRALPGASLVEKGLNLLFGFMLAVFIGPAVVEWLGVVSIKRAAGIIFVVGAAGLVLFGAIIDGIKQTSFGNIISGWLSRKTGGQ